MAVSISGQDVAGRCGVQDSLPGSALLALHARVEGVTREGLDAAIGEDRSLLTTWAMRGAPFAPPSSADAARVRAEAETLGPLRGAGYSSSARPHGEGRTTSVSMSTSAIPRRTASARIDTAHEESSRPPECGTDLSGGAEERFSFLGMSGRPAVSVGP